MTIGWTCFGLIVAADAFGIWVLSRVKKYSGDAQQSATRAEAAARTTVAARRPGATAESLSTALPIRETGQPRHRATPSRPARNAARSSNAFTGWGRDAEPVIDNVAAIETAIGDAGGSDIGTFDNTSCDTSSAVDTSSSTDSSCSVDGGY
jgi:hypothetical protein